MSFHKKVSCYFLKHYQMLSIKSSEAVRNAFRFLLLFLNEQRKAVLVITTNTINYEWILTEINYAMIKKIFGNIVSSTFFFFTASIKCSLTKKETIICPIKKNHSYSKSDFYLNRSEWLPVRSKMIVFSEET